MKAEPGPFRAMLGHLLAGALRRWLALKTGHSEEHVLRRQQQRVRLRFGKLATRRLELKFHLLNIRQRAGVRLHRYLSRPHKILCPHDRTLKPTKSLLRG